MRTSITTLIIFLLVSSGISQTASISKNERNTPTVKKEKLKDAAYLIDLAPELWNRLALSQADREELDRRRKSDSPTGYYLYSKSGYDNIDYVSVEISTVYSGKTMTASGTSNKLSAEQRNIINIADLGSEISMKIKFRYKDQGKEKSLKADKIVDGRLTVTIVPHTEAEYPGGFNKIKEYLEEYVNSRNPKYKGRSAQAIVQFSVNEKGQVTNAKISRSSSDPQTDALLLEGINKMQKWKAAENSSGMKVKQEFIIPLGDGC